MKNFKVTVELTTTRTVNVEASDETEARVKALVEAQALVGAHSADVIDIEQDKDAA